MFYLRLFHSPLLCLLDVEGPQVFGDEAGPLNRCVEQSPVPNLHWIMR